MRSRLLYVSTWNDTNGVSERGWVFTAPVQLTDAFIDLSNFKRYLRLQHLKTRMTDKHCQDFEIELRVIKRGKEDRSGETKEIMADTAAEFNSLKKKLITKADQYTLLGK